MSSAMDSDARRLLDEMCVKLMKDCYSSQRKLRAFIQSGKEPLAAFQEIVQSIKKITFHHNEFVAHFHHQDIKELKQELCFTPHAIDRQSIFKQATVITLDVDWSSDTCLDNVLIYLAECTNVEKIYIGTQPFEHQMQDIERHLASIRTSIFPQFACNPKILWLDGTDFGVEKDVNLDEILFKIQDVNWLPKLQKSKGWHPKKLVVEMELDMLEQFVAEIKLCPNLRAATTLTLSLKSAQKSHIPFLDSLTLITDQIRQVFPSLKELIIDPGTLISHGVLNLVQKPDVFEPSVHEIVDIFSNLRQLLQHHTEDYKVTVILRQEFHLALPFKNLFNRYMDAVEGVLPEFNRFPILDHRCRFAKTFDGLQCQLDVEFLFKKDPNDDMDTVTEMDQIAVKIHSLDDCLQKLTKKMCTKKLVVDINLDVFHSFVASVKSLYFLKNITHLTLNLSLVLKSYEDLVANMFDVTDQIRGVFGSLKILVIDPGVLTFERLLYTLPGVDDDEESIHQTAAEIKNPILELQKMFQDHKENYKILLFLNPKYSMLSRNEEEIFENYYYQLIAGFLEFKDKIVDDNKFKFFKFFEFTKFALDVHISFVNKIM